MREFDYPPFQPCSKHSAYSFWRFLECNQKFKQDVLSCEECKFPCGLCKSLLIKWNQDTIGTSPPFSESRRAQTNKDKLPQCLHCLIEGGKRACLSQETQSTACDFCKTKSVRCELFGFTNSDYRHLHTPNGTAIESSLPPGTTIPTQDEIGPSSTIKEGKKRRLNADHSPRPMQNQEVDTDTQNKIEAERGDATFNSLETSDIANTSEGIGSSSRITETVENSRAEETVSPQQVSGDPITWNTIPFIPQQEFEAFLYNLGPLESEPEGLTAIEYIGQIPVPTQDDVQSHGAWLMAISGVYSSEFAIQILFRIAPSYSIGDLLSSIERSMLSIRYFTELFLSDFDESDMQTLVKSYTFASRIRKNTQMIYDAIVVNGAQDDGSNLAGLLLDRIRLRREINRESTENVFGPLGRGDLGDGSRLDLAKRAQIFIFLFLLCLIHLPIVGQESLEHLR